MIFAAGSVLRRMRWGALASNILLLILVALWVTPTLGLLISSLRDKDQLANSGWWTALQTQERARRLRTAGPEEQRLGADGKWIISGTLIEESSRARVIGFSLLIDEPGKHSPGSVVVLANGSSLRVQGNGSYEHISDSPFSGKRGLRVFAVLSEPPALTLANYAEVIATEGVGKAFLNTLAVALPGTVIPLLVAALAAYALAWMRFPGRTVLYAAIAALFVVPLQMSLIPLLRLYNDIGSLLGVPAKSYLGIWLAHAGFGLPLAVFLLHQYISTLPREIIESAKMDGADHFHIFTRIVLPLSLPALASIAVLQFMWVWNDLLVALVFLGKGESQIVLTSKLRELIGSRGDNWEILTAGAFVSMTVPLLVFFALQRFFVRGLTTGAVKGG